MGCERKAIDDDPNGGQELPFAAVVFLVAVALIVCTLVIAFG